MKITDSKIVVMSIANIKNKKQWEKKSPMTEHEYLMRKD